MTLPTDTLLACNSSMSIPRRWSENLMGGKQHANGETVDVMGEEGIEPPSRRIEFFVGFFMTKRTPQKGRRLANHWRSHPQTTLPETGSLFPSKT